ncbi:ABC transporter ATP-binding protein [Virgibacillus kimchii]
MEIISAKNITFSYPDSKEPALKNVELSIEKGDFTVLCGTSGSGKSTLLRLLKYDIAPHGKRQGEIFYKGVNVQEILPLTRAKEIGMVFQDPDYQIVMDTVMDELLFGMENLGFSTEDMRKKMAEMVHFFGLNNLLRKKTEDLSGGEKQLVNLASVLLLDPEVLLLDEPTAQLDPIAAKEFIHTLERLNDEFGITIILVEHRLEELFAIADRVFILEEGSISYMGSPKEVTEVLVNHPTLHCFLPSAAQMYLHFNGFTNYKQIPVTVKEAKRWLDEQKIHKEILPERVALEKEVLLELKEIDFQYDKGASPVLHNLSLKVNRGEWHAILGANGTGKSTLLKAIAGIEKPLHGTLKYEGKKMKKIDLTEISYLPQNPALYFARDTLMEEYTAIANHFNIEKADSRIDKLLDLLQISHLKNRHPYDLSGGQLQKAALLGTLLTNPSLLLIDEPTKGLDADSKSKLANILKGLMEDGLTILMVSHDVEFAASNATTCSMLFEGQITVTEKTRPFFYENMYYTTVMNRITRKSHVSSVVTLQEAKHKWRMQKDL